ncbi:MAG: ATP-dependent RNA helicase DeaD [Halieaceae bacterium]|jgi:ATP-dependent RNA helicase DeaD
MSTESITSSFSELGLPASLMKALNEVGYETPSAIQAMTIPHLLEGRDVLGQAQTGTGKTAAFALPLLARLVSDQKSPQVLVLTPTRELAIQVAEAFQRYAAHIKGFHVLPIYGGQDYRTQLRQLERGVQVVVGTPGRVMDHMRRGSLKLDELRCLVLDEADEMLRMGFIDDVEWVLEKTPPKRQLALFSATMPAAIRRITHKYLNNPEEITIKVKQKTADTIRQRVWMVSGLHKLDALTRILEVEEFDAMLVFVRTKIATVELAEKLSARGYATAPLNGDIAQKQREQTVERLKKGGIDILVATDVAARGLDVGRISHVINYDIPYDVEAYVHRVGRTGRAGRTGDAILFASNRERRLLRAIEKSTGQDLVRMEMPTAAAVTDTRVKRFKDKISQTLSTSELDQFRKVIEEYQHEFGVPVIEIASALVAMAQGEQPLFVKEKPAHRERETNQSRGEGSKSPRRETRQGERGTAPNKRGEEQERHLPMPDKGFDRFRMAVGNKHGVKPGNIVGAIANEADIDSEYIGRIEIYEEYSTVDLPDGMPKEVFEHLKGVWVSGQRINIAPHHIGAAKKGPTGKKDRQSTTGKIDSKVPADNKERPAPTDKKESKGATDKKESKGPPVKKASKDPKDQKDSKDKKEKKAKKSKKEKKEKKEKMEKKEKKKT